MNYCLYCGNPVKNKYCDVSCQNKHLGTERENKKYGELKSFNVLCNKCGKEFEIQEREKFFPMKDKYYCSRSCANSRSHSEETKDKLIKKFSELFPKQQYTCLYCNKDFENSRKNRKFCSNLCSSKWRAAKFPDLMRDMGSKGGKKSVLSQNRRSKNENYFSELCCSFFNNVRLNEPIFNGWDADVILDDYKLAILWNGNWHHKQIGIKHSLLQVQNRDILKIKEIIKFGYTPYIINDYGKYDKVFVESEFEKLKNNIMK